MVKKINQSNQRKLRAGDGEDDRERARERETRLLRSGDRDRSAFTGMATTPSGKTLLRSGGKRGVGPTRCMSTCGKTRGIGGDGGGGGAANRQRAGRGMSL